MIQRLRKRQGGFTLIELLIVVAIIGIIAALLIPNFLDALQKAKQKRTVADERNLGTAQMAWLTDQIAAGAAGAAPSTFSLTGYSDMTATNWEDLLIPRYIQAVPDRDGWKNSYTFQGNSTTFDTGQQFVNISGGSGGSAATSWSPGAFDPTDYEQDIVWADGFFVRWPQKTTN